MVHGTSLLPGSPCSVVTMARSRRFVFVSAVLVLVCLWILYLGVSHIQVQPRIRGLATLETGDEHDENRNGSGR